MYKRYINSIIIITIIIIVIIIIKKNAKHGTVNSSNMKAKKEDLRKCRAKAKPTLTRRERCSRGSCNFRCQL